MSIFGDLLDDLDVRVVLRDGKPVAAGVQVGTPPARGITLTQILVFAAIVVVVITWDRR